MMDVLFFTVVVVFFGLLVGVAERIDRGRVPLSTIDRHRLWREAQS